MTARLASLVFLLALTFGCMSAPMSAPEAAYYPAEPGYPSGTEAAGYGGYSYEEDMLASEAPAMEMEKEVSVRSREVKGKKKGGNFRADKANKADEAIMVPEPEPGPMPSTTPTSDTTKTPQDGQSKEEPTDEEPDDRQIIYTASLLLAVYELDQAMAFAEDIPRRHGGWIQSRVDYLITLRVPAERLQVVIAELSTLGDVLGKTLQADDVTDQYTDLESRIAVLEQLEEQLVLLLKQAKTVEESLKVRQELERVRIELESAKAQMRQLAESIDFSTLSVSLTPRGPVDALPSSNDPFPWVDELGVESTEYR
jgi:hypothetical protein